MRMKFIAVALVALSVLAMGQKVKSKKEEAAVRALLAAHTPDAKIAAAEELLTKYKDTEFKAYALVQAGQAAQQKGDVIAALQYGNRALEADPKNYQALLLVSGLVAQGTREFDLDKDEKVAHATKLADEAIAAVNEAVKPNPALTDEQWEGIKKDFVAQAHDTLGVVAVVQKKFDVAINEFKMSIDGAATPDMATPIRLAAAYTDAGKFDESSATLDKVLATPDLPDAFKRAATLEKARVEKARAATK
jgi:tetratricopeptide (TPR) repeat protein